MAPKSQQAEVAQADGTQSQMQVNTPTALDRFAEYMKSRAKLDGSMREGSSAMDAISERLLTATEDELWDIDEGGLPNGKAVADIEQRIMSYEIMMGKGKPDDEIVKNNKLGGTYLNVHSVRLDSGKEFDWQTSAPGIVIKVVRFDQAGRLPLNCVVRAIPIADGEPGQVVLKLRPIATRAI
jgi:hypothetical protein